MTMRYRDEEMGPIPGDEKKGTLTTAEVRRYADSLPRPSKPPGRERSPDIREAESTTAGSTRPAKVQPVPQAAQAVKSSTTKPPRAAGRRPAR